MESVYEDWYRERFAQKGIRLCELGIWEGDSVRWWQQHAEPVVHVGLDVRPRPSSYNVPDRYVHVVGSQDWPADLLKVVDRGPYDLVIDDAAHNDAAVVSFRYLWPSVVPGGCYVIEDWQAPWLHYLAPGEDVGLVAFVTELVREVGMAWGCQPPSFREFAGGARWGNIVSCEIRPGIAAFWKADAPRST